ncbi:uncharacterized protein JCM6883_004238 [Sporobolomyces salmoneus]|uniref:uncharacterized protein n=1 Tax=Sporobolomyces salmoneus TaxID=183962 RepID=UPI00316FEEDB
MLGFRIASSLLLLLVHVTYTLSTSHSNATHPLLFPPFASSQTTLPTLHTSLSTLLPILPYLSPPPEHTLLVTLATPAFKPLLLNWICFLRFRAKWGAKATHNEHGDENQFEDPYESTLKLLVITSDEGLARELSELGVVTWWLKGIDWDEVERVAGLDVEEDGDSAEIAMAKVEQMLQDDLFTNLRLLELLLPSEPASNNQSKKLTSSLIPWGTLHYQSLMLERTAVMSALVGSLVESQIMEKGFKKEEEQFWRRKIMSHDWENEEPLELPQFAGVKGVLLVDNDAVWLSSPTAFIAHHYRPGGSHPSIVFAPDMAPTTVNAWGTREIPCACFFYTRTSDSGAQLAHHHPLSTISDPYDYSPSRGAAQAWRTTAICHISMLLRSLATGRRLAYEPDSKIAELTKARAPSFQATALGPALFLAEQILPSLPEPHHEQWMEALGSGNIDDIIDILDESMLSLDDQNGGRTCLQTAQDFQTFSPNPAFLFDSGITSLTAQYSRSAQLTFGPTAKAHSAIRTEALPYDLFPPGMRFFDGGLEPGTKPCVVHANYATGSRKEELLRKRGMWALLRGEGEEGGGWRCDAEIMARA